MIVIVTVKFLSLISPLIFYLSLVLAPSSLSLSLSSPLCTGSGYFATLQRLIQRFLAGRSASRLVCLKQRELMIRVLLSLTADRKIVDYFPAPFLLLAPFFFFPSSSYSATSNRQTDRQSLRYWTVLIATDH